MSSPSRRQLAAIARVFACLVALSSSAAAQTAASEGKVDDALFERVFKHRERSERAPVMVVLDGVEVGPSVLWLQPGGTPRVPVEPLLSALLTRLRSESHAALRAAAQNGYFSLDALRALGLEVVYDEAELELLVTVPALLTEATSHNLRANGAPPEAAGALQPSDASGYLNLRAGGSDTWTTGEVKASRVPAHLNLDSALRVSGWLLEGKMDFAEAPSGVHRGDVLLSRDDPEAALRYLAGDFGVAPSGLQVSYPVLGLGMARNFALQPYRVIQPVGQFDFVLDEPSTVAVIVNGNPVQTLSLAAGRHDVRDLPLGPGVSDVELLIEDRAGVQRRISFASASTAELLAPGVSQFALDLGAPLIDDVGARRYALTEPILSARGRWGLSSSLTLGGSFDGSLEQQRAGSELTLATAVGTLTLDVAGSLAAVSGLGHAEGVRYDYARTGKGAQLTSFTAVGHHYSSGYVSLGPLTPPTLYGDDLTLSASRLLPATVLAAVSARYQVGRQRPDAQEASLRLSRSFGPVGVEGALTGRHDGVAPDEARVLLSVRIQLPEGRGVVLAAARTSNVNGTSSEATYASMAGPPPGGVTTTVGVQETPDQVGANGTVTYTGGRLTASVSTATTLDRSHGWATQTSSLELGTGLVFADGVVAWTRPVTGSFVVVDKNPSISEQDVEVNPALEGYAARADAFGPAVLPNLEPYRVATLTVAAPDLPMGYSLGSDSYLLLPAYKSGTLLRVGSEGTVFLRGTLQHADGSPAAFATAELTQPEGLVPPLVLMTNRAGRFSLIGLRPGRWELRISGAEMPPLVIEIPEKNTGLHSAGVLIVD